MKRETLFPLTCCLFTLTLIFTGCSQSYKKSPDIIAKYESLQNEDHPADDNDGGIYIKGEDVDIKQDLMIAVNYTGDNFVRQSDKIDKSYLATDNELEYIYVKPVNEAQLKLTAKRSIEELITTEINASEVSEITKSKIDGYDCYSFNYIGAPAAYTYSGERPSTSFDCTAKLINITDNVWIWLEASTDSMENTKKVIQDIKLKVTYM